MGVKLGHLRHASVCAADEVRQPKVVGRVQECQVFGAGLWQPGVVTVMWKTLSKAMALCGILDVRSLALILLSTDRLLPQ